ncbi:MAG: Crp/Fnr family transcriptional regulator [Anaerocolumna sp.]
MISDQDYKYLIETFTFWDKLKEEHKNKIISNTELVHYEKNNRVHSGGNDCIGVILIKTGSLRIYILSEEGKEVTLYRLRAGDICILSASCILENITFDVHIDAENECDALVVDSGTYHQICKQNMYAENFTNKLVIEAFSEVMWAMEQILFMSFDKRLAIFLLDESSRQQVDTLEFTHEQIAKYIGSAREVVSRMLKYFSTEGMVELYRGGVRLVDKKRLKEISR